MINTKINAILIDSQTKVHNFTMHKEFKFEFKNGTFKAITQDVNVLNTHYENGKVYALNIRVSHEGTFHIEGIKQLEEQQNIEFKV